MQLNQQANDNLGVIRIDELEEFIRAYRKKNGQCPECGTTKIWGHGSTNKLKHRYRCLNESCKVETFTDEKE